MKRKSMGILAVVCCICVIGALGLRYYMQTAAFMESAGQTIASVATETLGVQVDVGDVEVTSFRTLELHNLAIYDKQAAVIARAEKAQVTYRLLSALSAPLLPVRFLRAAALRNPLHPFGEPFRLRGKCQPEKLFFRAVR